MQKRQIITFQCRGPKGLLERDVGAVAGYDEEGKIISLSCPHNEGHITCEGEGFKDEDEAKCFLYKFNI